MSAAELRAKFPDPRATSTSSSPSTPSGAVPPPAAGPSGAQPRRTLADIRNSAEQASAALNPSRNESVETPAGQIQKFRQLVDEVQGRDALGWNDEVPDTTPTKPKKISTLAGGTGQTSIRNTDVRAPGPPVDSIAAGKASNAWNLIKNIPGVKQAIQVATPAGKQAARLLPGAGAVLGAQDVAFRTAAGDETGAVIGLLTMVASSLPVPVLSEFAAALGITVQMARDKIRTGSIMPSEAEILNAVAADQMEKRKKEEHVKQLKQDLTDLRPYLTDKTLSPKDQILSKSLANKISRDLNIAVNGEAGGGWDRVGIPGHRRKAPVYKYK